MGVCIHVDWKRVLTHKVFTLHKIRETFDRRHLQKFLDFSMEVSQCTVAKILSLVGLVDPVYTHRHNTRLTALGPGPPG